MCKLLSISLLILEISLFSASQSYQLVFEDDFNESSLNTNDWTISQDPVGNTNNELQSYDPANIQVANGILSITAKIDSYYQGKPIYSSGKIDTKSAHTFKYGRFEVRMKVPRGKGMWPAFWMLPSTSMYGPWAKSGEIDIAEVRGSQSQTVLGTIHYGNVSNSETYTTASYSIAGGHSLADDFHVYAVEWDQEPPSIRWFLDGINYANQTAWFSVGNPYPAPFDQPFYIILNLAIGGLFDGDPNNCTVFPQSLLVDYVRAYSNPDSAGSTGTSSSNTGSLSVSDIVAIVIAGGLLIMCTGVLIARRARRAIKGGNFATDEAEELQRMQTIIAAARGRGNSAVKWSAKSPSSSPNLNPNPNPSPSRGQRYPAPSPISQRDSSRIRPQPRSVSSRRQIGHVESELSHANTNHLSNRTEVFSQTETSQMELALPLTSAAVGTNHDASAPVYVPAYELDVESAKGCSTCSANELSLRESGWSPRDSDIQNLSGAVTAT